jgi:hypothetical protein
MIILSSVFSAERCIGGKHREATNNDDVKSDYGGEC